MNEQLELIKTEVERLRSMAKNIADVSHANGNLTLRDFYDAQSDAYVTILEYINAFSDTTKNVNLNYETEQEIKRVYERYETPGFLDYDSFAEIARYFIDWQKRQMEMDMEKSSFDCIVETSGDSPKLYPKYTELEPLLRELGIQDEDIVKLTITKKNKQ